VINLHRPSLRTSWGNKPRKRKQKIQPRTRQRNPQDESYHRRIGQSTQKRGEGWRPLGGRSPRGKNEEEHVL